jgi:hypothetical protein
MVGFGSEYTGIVSWWLCEDLVLLAPRTEFVITDTRVGQEDGY